MSVLRLLACWLCLAVSAGVAGAAEFPTRPLRLVVPYPPGGSTDVLARMVAESLRERLEQPVIVENRAGAGTLVGTEAVARAAPDGYTLLLTSSAYTINPAINPRFRYDAKEMQPVFLMVKLPHVLVVSAASPYKTVGDLVAAAKQRPGALNYASSGIGTSTHLEGEMLAQLAGIKLVHVPYGGAAPGITDLISGQVQLMFGSLPALLPHIKAGRLRALGATVAEPMPQLPDAPPIAAAGVAGYDVADWLGILAPAATDAAALAKLVDALSKTFVDAKFVGRLNELGMKVVAQGPASFADLLRNDPLPKIARDAGIRVAD